MVRSPSSRNRAPFRWLRRFGASIRGATAIEYGLILALVALSIMASLIEVANTTTGMWNKINTEVTKAR